MTLTITFILIVMIIIFIYLWHAGVMMLGLLENMLLVGYNVMIYGNTYFLKVNANPIAGAADYVYP